MTLAQQTPILLLDEPTTFLDIAHQVELMELFTDLHQQGRTLVAVLHDLNQAARYATHLIVMSAGKIVATGPPKEIIDEDPSTRSSGWPAGSSTTRWPARRWWSRWAETARPCRRQLESSSRIVPMTVDGPANVAL